MAAVWSTPYYGVSHLTVHNRQCSIEDYGSFVTATVFPVPGSTYYFWTDAITQSFGTAVEAKAWCERTARPSQ